ncbi:unnamed protein product [Lactuca virosa]|uniref:DUF4283 domain-containing protein n=1 Tax=Lactuca virosa TaxID=75947 RepID=A0AAU9NXG2_9ASTR|nr:unnamed protein product [Lactuca virosa]
MQPKPPSPPITLNSRTCMKTWLSKSTLIGEAHSLDHIGSLPATILISDNTKYLGGLNIAIHFGSSVEAKDFLEDENRWRDWFRWMVKSDQQELRYERIAWLKIIGLPLKLWDEENFNLIASRFGRVINPFDGIGNRRDYSMGKVGVLTSEKKWINEEITITADDVKHQIGVVEYTDDWSPFKPVPFDKVDDDSDDEGD